MKPRTNSEIKEELVRLDEIGRRVRPVSMFGEDNIAAVAAQIIVLTHVLSIKQISEAFGEEPDNVHDAALDARRWLLGEEGAVAPSKDWGEVAPSSWPVRTVMH